MSVFLTDEHVLNPTPCEGCGANLNIYSVESGLPLCGRCREDENMPIYKLLRETLRHYTEFKAHVAATGQHVIEYKGIEISFLDLEKGISELSPRKKEALLHNVIFDKKQKDVAKIMGITTVSVGQYVDGAVQQLAIRYFAERKENNEEVDVEDV